MVSPNFQRYIFIWWLSWLCNTILIFYRYNKVFTGKVVLRSGLFAKNVDKNLWMSKLIHWTTYIICFFPLAKKTLLNKKVFMGFWKSTLILSILCRMDNIYPLDINKSEILYWLSDSNQYMRIQRNARWPEKQRQKGSFPKS